jgi:NAD(P)-dependent dehydrogenase (short-subunit alcohol dehydrogenase family)
MSQTYLVTGAGRGIGLEFARQLKARGDQVVATAREPEAAADLRSLGVRVEALNVAAGDSVRGLAERLEGVPIDVLVNNAGIGGDASPVTELDFVRLTRFFEVNAIGPLRVTQALLPNLRAGKRRLIVSLTSQMGSIGLNDQGGYYGYRASKAALNMLSRTLALELAGKGYTSIVVNPGWVRTDMGGPQAPLTPETSVRGMLKVLDRLTPKDTGSFFSWNGERLPW